MVVAMKVLRVPTHDSMMREFEREIKFMQTVRHPNIVLFLGAGRTKDGSPFLISEFVSRGSLRVLLDDSSQDLSFDRKVKYCLDIAHGMNFLHSLTPPRVHRDLKSDNLLISETDVVKIADFGLGKQVTGNLSRNSHQDQARRRFSIRRRLFNRMSSSRLPFLDLAGHDSPHARGAARWRAPELSISGSGEQYTMAADVYSFGIVMWEIVTRQLPFENYEFNYEVLDAVKRGERLPLPSSCPSEMEILIKDCWKADPCERPLFDEIESRLAAING
jgi:serine/threonine protein kinase